MGTTTDKTTYLNTTKLKIKDGINRLGGELTNLSTFRSYAEALDSIYDTLPKVSDTGSNLSLSPTLKGALGTIPLGNCEQDTYTGKNLLNCNLETQTLNGLTITKNNDGSYTINGTTNATTNIIWFQGSLQLKAGTYYIGLVTTTENLNLYLVNGGNTILEQPATSPYTQLTLENDKTYTSLRSYMGSNKTFNNVTFYPMITTTLPFTYEKYTGGIPSPNPSYPQPIKVVTGDNEVDVCNKNIFNDDFLNEHYTKDENGYYTDGILSFNNYFNTNLPTIIFKENTQYTFQWYGYNDSGGNCRIQYFYTDGTSEGGGNLTTTPELHTFTSALNKTIDHINFTYGSSGSRTIHVKNIQLEVGTTATSYVAHQEQSYTLHLGDTELCKIGDYQDVITGSKDNWKVVRKISKVIVNGTEDWRQFWQVGNYVFTDNNIISGQNSINGLSNKLECVTRTYIRNNLSVANNMCAFTKGEFIISIQTITSVADFKTWLASNNITCYYILETPTEETITDTTLINELNELQELLSYDGTTNITITSDSNNAQMLVQVSALKGE